MSKGYSLHIGLNKLDAEQYPGAPALKAAVNDAVFWESFAKQEGYETMALHDKEAKAEPVIKQLNKYASIMKPGDILLLTYAGHGGEIPNDKPAGFDNERNDQTWCLYDRQLLDDELYECFEAFKEGTRILVVSDSCHSGTITKDVALNFSTMLGEGMANGSKARGFASRKLPKEVEQMALVRFADTVYKPLQKKYTIKKQAAGIKAAVKLMAACQDDEETMDGAHNGIFTEAFMELFKSAENKKANAEKLIELVSARYYFPRPNFFQYGSIIPAFDKGFPFTIKIDGADKVTGFRKPDLKGSKKTREYKPVSEQRGTTEIQKAAVLVIDVKGGIKGNWIAGNDIVVLDKQKNSSREVITIEIPAVPNDNAWSAAHAIQTGLDKEKYDSIVEPIVTTNAAQREPVSREADHNNPGYIAEWPPVLGQDHGAIGWHLDEDHSQLAKAHEFVIQQNPDAHIRIAHFDTGYIEGHIALPTGLNTTLAHSFVDKENPNQAIDKTDSGQDGHGLGTITILAGRSVPMSATFNEYEGFIGGIPFADVVPVRVSESVVIFNSENFCKAIDYAIENKCEVVSMSFAGKPSRRMTRAVNDAYEAGIVLVTAASNCWYKGTGSLLPKCVLYPAAFERVIAATGAMFDHKPYDSKFMLESTSRAIGTKYMQGCWGPASRMTRALAAYTPNIPWASTEPAFLRSGGGTSSATPQVAATAALWIAHHRKELEDKGYYTEGNQWKKVEAVRQALYFSSAKDAVFPEWKKYYGNGIIRALDALDVDVPDESLLDKAPEAEGSFFGISELVGSFFKNRLFRSDAPKPGPEALSIELMQLLQTDPQFYELFSELDLSDAAAVEAAVNNESFKQKVIRSAYASEYLKGAMAG